MSKISIKPSSTGTGTFTIEAPNSNYNRNFMLPDESGVVITNNRQLSFRNKIINGNFDIWQRGTSQTTIGYGSADRWVCGNVGTTKTASQQSFALGQTDVPGNPKYYMRHEITSVAGANNECRVVQKIESVLTLTGKQATLSFWAKANSNKNIAIEFVQSFGTGGTPSTAITGIGSQLVALTTSWKQYTITVNIPSITGKTIGTNGDDSLSVHFWFDAGSSLASRTANLGQQSGTFDIAQVQLEEGSVATPFEERPIGVELALCQRYYEKSYLLDTYPGTVGGLGAMSSAILTTYLLHSPTTRFITRKRGIPSVSIYSPNSGEVSKVAEYTTASTLSGNKVVQATSISQCAFNVSFSSSSGTVGNTCQWQWTADAEL